MSLSLTRGETCREAYIELRKTLNEDRLERCWELEKAGYQLIECVEGEENFAEMCATNEWEFYEDGEMYLGMLH